MERNSPPIKLLSQLACRQTVDREKIDPDILLDFLLMDIPRLILSSDFPVEADRHLAANGLNPTTSYWFGQKDKEETEEEEGN